MLPVLQRGKRKAVCKVVQTIQEDNGVAADGAALAVERVENVTAVAAAKSAPDVEAEAAASTPAKRARKKPPPPPPALLYSTDMRPSRYEGAALRVASWNVASLRSLLKKDPQALRRLAQEEALDVLCLQETKLQDKDVAKLEDALGLPGWHRYWDCSTARKGYSGTALFSRRKPLKVRIGLGVPEHDAEGRLIAAEFPACFVVNVYVPNAGEGLKRLVYRVGAWDTVLADYVAGLAARKPVVLTGDFNCAYQEIDIHNPKSNLRSAGFTVEERESFGERLLGRGLVDAWRAQHPGVTGYTYWNYRTLARGRNAGWRLDYFLVSEALAGSVHDCFHRPDVLGSDHCPVGLVLRLDGAGPVPAPAAAPLAPAEVPPGFAAAPPAQP